MGSPQNSLDLRSKSQICPKIIYYIFIYLGVYTLFIQSIGSEIGSVMDNYSTSLGFSINSFAHFLNNNKLIEEEKEDDFNKIDSKIENSILSPKIKKIESLNRKNILNEGSKFSSNIKETINKVKNNEISSLEGQIKIEGKCLSQEEMFFNNLISSLNNRDSSTNPLRLKLVNDWEFKLNNTLFKYLQPYLINNYRKLENDIKTMNRRTKYASFVLLVLSLNGNFNKKDNKSNKVISLMMVIIMRLLVINNELGAGEIKKIHLCMELANNLIYRAPLILPPELKLNHLQEYYENNVLNNMSEDIKASIGSALLDLVLESVDILNENGISYDSKEKKSYSIISITHSYRDELLRRSISPIMLPMIVEPLE